MKKQITLALLLSIFLIGCANIDSIDRTTSLPADDDEDGVAIHLDAKQRLVVAKSFGTVCAEPSPDALSAFSASLGASIARPGADPDTLATAVQSTAASIGLRTQSITLMRDALYRICEAYYGRALTGPAVMTLLARSQDLTATILAIEQLTGPVVANQVVLQGEALARSSAGLVQLQGLLDAAREDEQKQKDVLDKARQEAEKDPDDDKKGEAVTSAETAYSEAKQLSEKLKENRDTALSEPSAMVKGHPRFSEPAEALLLDTKSRGEVATAVKEIVKMVLNQNYVEEACIALIADNPPKRAHFKCKRDIAPAQCKQEANYGDALTAWRVARDFCAKKLGEN